MPRLIEVQGEVRDEWRMLDDDSIPMPSDAKAIIPLKRWLDLGDAFPGVGVLLQPDDDARTLVESARWRSQPPALIAVNFPKFTDGRGRSTARQLRSQLGWQGPLRAVGDILRDQLFHLARLGFDQFELRDDQNLDECLLAFDDFSGAYQRSSDHRPEALAA